MAYIYVIKNNINDKKYIGKTNYSIEKRFKEHLRDATKVRKEKRPLYNAICKYGKEHFSIQILEEVDPVHASEREKYWISFYDTFNNGYNATLGGDGKNYINYKKILKLFDETILSKKEIASECQCSVKTVSNIISQYRGDVDWSMRYHMNNSTSTGLNIKGIPVRCIETQQKFHSATAAANWLVKNGKIKSQAYGRNKIPKVCRGERKTLGGYHWEFI